MGNTPDSKLSPSLSSPPATTTSSSLSSSFSFASSRSSISSSRVGEKGKGVAATSAAVIVPPTHPFDKYGHRRSCLRGVIPTLPKIGGGGGNTATATAGGHSSSSSSSSSLSVLFQLIFLKDWQRVIIRATLFPNEINQSCCIKLYNIEWKLLPLHVACALQPPTKVISILSSQKNATCPVLSKKYHDDEQRQQRRLRRHHHRRRRRQQQQYRHRQRKMNLSSSFKLYRWYYSSSSAEDRKRLLLSSTASQEDDESFEVAPEAAAVAAAAAAAAAASSYDADDDDNDKDNDYLSTASSDLNMNNNVNDNANTNSGQWRKFRNSYYRRGGYSYGDGDGGGGGRGVMAEGLETSSFVSLEESIGDAAEETTTATTLEDHEASSLCRFLSKSGIVLQLTETGGILPMPVVVPQQHQHQHQQHQQDPGQEHASKKDVETTNFSKEKAVVPSSTDLLEFPYDSLLYAATETKTLLPIHIACLYQASPSVIQLLITDYPTGALSAIIGMLPIHFIAAGWYLEPLESVIKTSTTGFGGGSGTSMRSLYSSMHSSMSMSLSMLGTDGGMSYNCSQALKVLAHAVPESLSAKSATHNMTPPEYIDQNNIMNQEEKEDCWNIIQQEGADYYYFRGRNDTNDVVVDTSSSLKKDHKKKNIIPTEIHCLSTRTTRTTTPPTTTTTNERSLIESNDFKRNNDDMFVKDDDDDDDNDGKTPTKPSTSATTTKLLTESIFYKLLIEEKFSQAIKLLKENPMEAKIWYYGIDENNHDNNNIDTNSNEKNDYHVNNDENNRNVKNSLVSPSSSSISSLSMPSSTSSSSSSSSSSSPMVVLQKQKKTKNDDGPEQVQQLHQPLLLQSSQPTLWKRLALHLACTVKAIPRNIIELLIQLYPNALESYDPHSGDIPLHLACAYLHRNKQPHDQNRHQHHEATTSSSSSSSSSALEIIRLLVNAKKHSTKVVNIHGRLPLHVAIINAAPYSIIEYLIRHDPGTVLCPDGNGKTPLQYAKECYPYGSPIIGLLEVVWM